MALFSIAASSTRPGRRRRLLTAAGTALLLALSTAPTAVAASANPARSSPKQKLTAYANAVVRTGVPGVIVELDRRGVRTTALVGLSDRLTGQHLSLDDHYRIASQTKTFIATLVLQLVAEGKVDLDTSIGTYLPGVVENGNQITVRMLLDHTSGLPDIYDLLLKTLPELRHVQHTTYQPRQLVAMANAQPLLFPPGTKWSYSNTEYIVLGLLVERETHRSLGQVLQDRIFGPLHLRDTSFPGSDPRLPAPYLHGYLGWDNDRLFLDVSRFNESFIWAAGAAISTESDIGRFQTALFSGRLLPPALLKEMEAPVDTGSPGYGYGLGLEEYTLPCGTAIGHTGGLPGYATISFTLRGTTTSVRLATNWYYATSEALEATYNLAFGALCSIDPSDTSSLHGATTLAMRHGGLS